MDLISAVTSKAYLGGDNQNQHDVLAPYRGFWPPKKENRPLNNTDFKNPYVYRIKMSDLTVTRNSEGEEIHCLE